MPTFELTGKLIAKYDEQQVTDRFKKREFVIETKEDYQGKEYSNFVKMQTVQTNCDKLNAHDVGDTLKVSFNIRGSKFDKGGKTQFMTSLEAWRIESVSKGNPRNARTTADDYAQHRADALGGDDSLPF